MASLGAACACALLVSEAERDCQLLQHASRDESPPGHMPAAASARSAAPQTRAGRASCLSHGHASAVASHRLTRSSKYSATRAAHASPERHSPPRREETDTYRRDSCHDAGVTAVTHTHTTLTLHLTQVARFDVAAAPMSRQPPTAAPVALLSLVVTRQAASGPRNRSLPRVLPPSRVTAAAVCRWRHTTVDVVVRLAGRQRSRLASSPSPPFHPLRVATPLVHPGSHAHHSRRCVSAHESRCIAVGGPPSASPRLILDHRARPPRPPRGLPYQLLAVVVLATRPDA